VKTKRKNTELFIKECIRVRSNLYDYSLVSYKKSNNIRLIRIKFDDDIKNKLNECLL